MQIRISRYHAPKPSGATTLNGTSLAAPKLSASEIWGLASDAEQYSTTVILPFEPLTFGFF
jgi:hypothetical protein